MPLLEPELKHVIPINAKTAFVSDLDNDGTNELLVGTYQSAGKDRIILYKFISGSYQPIWNYDIDDTGYGAVTAITTGDTDNDGLKRWSCRQECAATVVVGQSTETCVFSNDLPGAEFLEP